MCAWMRKKAICNTFRLFLAWPCTFSVLTEGDKADKPFVALIFYGV